MKGAELYGNEPSSWVIKRGENGAIASLTLLATATTPTRVFQESDRSHIDPIADDLFALVRLAEAQGLQAGIAQERRQNDLDTERQAMLIRRAWQELAASRNVYHESPSRAFEYLRSAHDTLRRVLGSPSPDPHAAANPDLFDETKITGERPIRRRKRKP